MRPPTMRDVAALAGVSLKTVSRVVNSEAGVSQPLERKVREAVDLLGYRPNVTASSLRRADQKTQTIGLLLEDVANPFSSALHRAIEDVAVPRGTLVLAASADEDPARERELLLEFVSRRVDGLIVIPVGSDQSQMLRERRLGRPLVFIDRVGAVGDADSVTADNRGGVRAAVRHLVAHGHRRIAFLGDASWIWTAAERHRGYLEAIASCGISLDPSLVFLDIRNSSAATEVVRELLAREDAPTAIFAAQNLITIGAIRALQQLSRQHDVALVGFDDVVLADLVHPPVTVVAQDASALGRTAAELLFGRLAGDRSPPRHIVVPTKLIPRGSGELAA
ncbi:MAG: LacI family DNA-binding transcriptional regulator [Gaiellaceae bacterium]